MKTCVIIPTYNEAKSITNLISQIRSQNLEVIVVDDGSSDDTAKIARQCGAITIQNQNNEGKGTSLIKGFDYALKNDFDAVITMDGDGQHLPEDIPYFMRLAKYSDSDILIGNRMHKTRNMPWVRFVTNRLMSRFISCLAKQRIFDTQCGFRLIKKDVLKKVRLITSKYETESEILIQAARLGYKINSLAVKTVYTGTKSQINPLRDTFRFISYILGTMFVR